MAAILKIVKSQYLSKNIIRFWQNLVYYSRCWTWWDLEKHYHSILDVIERAAVQRDLSEAVTTSEACRPRYRSAAAETKSGLVCQRPTSNFPYFRTSFANFLLSRPNSVEYGNSKTTTLLPSVKWTRPLFQGRTGCGGRPSGWHDIVVTCHRLVHNNFYKYAQIFMIFGTHLCKSILIILVNLLRTLRAV